MRKYFFKKVVTEELLCRNFNQLPLFVHLFECRLKIGKMFLFMILEEDNHVLIKIKEFSEGDDLRTEIFS
jgi:hypothetical protein